VYFSIFSPHSIYALLSFELLALVMEEEVMRLDYKLAVLKSGRYQFEIAHESGLSEGRLSRFIRGREHLRPAEEQRLRMVLGLVEETEEIYAG
jgi:hypothetical protein